MNHGVRSIFEPALRAGSCRRSSRARGMLAALLAQAEPADAQQNRPQTGAQNAAPARAAPSLAPVLKKITPAVVSIETKFRAQDAKNRRRDARDPPGNVGSGVVFDAKRGLIITNNHVIDRADDITVTFTDGRMFKAKRVGTDPEFDLAVISVDADNLPVDPVRRFAPARGRRLRARDRLSRQYRAIGHLRASSAACTAPMSVSSSSRTSSRPTPRSIPEIPAARWSTFRATSSASTPPSSARPAPIPAWASRSR